MRLSFLVPSSYSPDARDREENLGWLSIFENEWAIAELGAMADTRRYSCTLYRDVHGVWLSR